MKKQNKKIISKKKRKLEIGSGNRPLPGYEHLDIDPSCPDLDFCCSMDKIPVKNNTFDEIVSIHTLEHISWRKGLPTLVEWHRAMKPGGKVRIEVPNLRWICKAYLDNGKDWYESFKGLHPDERKHMRINKFDSHTLWANFKLFSSTANGDIHLAGYDKFLLENMLIKAGFKSIETLCDHDVLIMEAYK